MLFQEMLSGFALHEIILDDQGRAVDYRFLSINPAFERMTGLKAADIIGKTVLEVMPGTEPYWIETYGRVALTGEAAFFENYSRETQKLFEVSAYQPARNQFACIFRDITQRKQAELDLKSAYTKLEALWSITALEEADLKTMSDYILVTIVRMTGSEYGFYGFVNEDESVMTIHSWSGVAMKDCSIVDQPQHFSVSEAGIWAEAIRRREPFILNDYGKEQPAQKGLPVWHVDLKNLLVVPHILHGRIQSVAVVANRLSDYNQEDVAQIGAFLTSIEAIIARKRSEEELQKSHHLLTTLAEQVPDVIYQYRLYPDGRLFPLRESGN
jgi:PAS domain S-box-containing protein